MSRVTARLCTALFAILLASRCTSSEALFGTPPALGPDAAAVARAAAANVGVVGTSHIGRTPVAVILLEESHNSRVGQLQHAVTLARLHDTQGLTTIVLEGYLQERPAIDTRWFATARGADDPVARARVAVQFLKQGEIGAAEFIKLVYPEVRLAASETEATYRAALPESLPPVDYLERIAEVDRGWAAERQRHFESAEAIQALSGDQHLAMALEIKSFAESRRVSIPAEMATGMDTFIAFWRKRMASNMTIAAAIPPPSGAAEQAIAVNIGSFHTAGLSELLTNAGRSYAVVTPAYTTGDAALSDGRRRGDLTDDMYARKTRRHSVFDRGVATLVAQSSGHSLKPEPVLEEDFFRAEGELYALVTRLAEAVLAPGGTGGQPPGGGKPPFGLASGDFDGKMLSILLSQVQFLPGDGRKRNALLIPVQFKRSGVTLWVGTVLSRGPETSTHATIESLLMDALREVQAERQTPETAEDAQGRLKMDHQTLTVISRSEAAARKAILAES